MKIYILPVSNEVKPAHGFISPAHNQDYGCEQDILVWLLQHPEYLTDDPAQADFNLFQPFWNRFYTNHWGAKWEVLQDEILRLVSRNRSTFTVCEYDVSSLQPFIDLCNMTVFTASRNGDKGIDIPLLCSPHQEKTHNLNRRYLASFMGKFETSGYRGQIQEALQGRNDVYLSPGIDTRQYVDLFLNSEIALAPRGHGGQSFRFYEAMQFACVPFLIGDLDTRPFKRWLDWDSCSLYTNDVAIVARILDSDWLPGELRQMGHLARQLWQNEIGYGQWCKYLIKELEVIC
jgi:hypothetical protein